MCVQVAQKPRNWPAVGWVMTVSPTITPDPTGTSAVLAMGPAAHCWVWGRGAADAALAPMVASAAVAATTPTPPTIAVRRSTRSSSMLMIGLLLGL